MFRVLGGLFLHLNFFFKNEEAGPIVGSDLLLQNLMVTIQIVRIQLSHPHFKERHVFLQHHGVVQNPTYNHGSLDLIVMNSKGKEQFPPLLAGDFDTSGKFKEIPSAMPT